ncbi:hypothetical protein BUALT_Bualt06G0020000 [Buddleja alternifolia]|uniref:Uncharacterized protein n=1 Tax=Buddleja alternifolia TaxID=168488 RepID=A0AAV6XMW1_9LAMI|nr:hypothetical protein BUALT_Bualt06G0020000 [Buddleja alternifolia]
MSSGPGGVGALKRIRNMRSSKTGLDSSSTMVVNKKSSAPDSSPLTSTIQATSQNRLSGIKRVRLMRSSKDSLDSSGAKSPSVSASASTSQALSQDGVQSLAPQWGFGLDPRAFRTSPSRAQTHDGYETSHVQNIDTSAGSRRATQDLDSSAPLHSASVGHPDDGIETSTTQNATGSMGSKKGRGVAKGWKLDKQVKKHGKYKIIFRPGLKYSTEHESEFTDGLGIVIKTNAEIQGWSTDDRVHMIVDYRLQTAYTRWRNTLHKVYKKLVDEGINPREVCPREDLSMTKWQAACDFIEDEKFQVKKSRILLWRDTHVSKKNGGRFVNSTTQSLHEKMIATQNQSVNDDEEPPSEEAILESTLGRRSGYIKGMGHGVEVVRGRRASSYTVDNAELKEKLEQLENAKDKIVNLTEAYEEQRITLDEQKKEMEVYKEQNKTYSQEIDALKAQMAKMEQVLQTFLK